MQRDLQARERVPGMKIPSQFAKTPAAQLKAVKAAEPEGPSSSNSLAARMH